MFYVFFLIFFVKCVYTIETQAKRPTVRIKQGVVAGGVSEDSPLSVVVFFEGSEFAQGNRFPISGQDLAVEGVVVVNANYRLNIFGFLCFENKEARGNMGLLDQYLSLIWVKENIRKFGGDSEKVTLFGYSAGAASATLHMISIRTADLFQKVILSSGSILSPWHTKNNVVKASQTVAGILGCFSNYAKSTLRCLRSKSTAEILKAYEEYVDSSNYTDRFSPVVDDFLFLNDQYLPFNFENALKSGVSMQVPILTGLGTPVSDPIFGRWSNIINGGYKEFKNFVEEIIIPEIMKKYNFKGKNENLISDLLKWRYVTSSNGRTDILENLLIQLYFEAKTEIPVFLQTNHFLSSHRSPIYVYYVDDIGLKFNSSDYITSSDLILLFGPLLLNQAGRRRFTYWENSISERIKSLWINFINYGNPTPNYQKKVWPNYKANENHIQYFSNKDDIEITRKEFERMRSYYFWNDVLKSLALNTELINDAQTENFQKTAGPECKHATYTLTGLVIALLLMLFICVILLKRRSNELHWQFQTSL
ncbi:acylcarnitine hydrolase isoform X2 [Agrilus planipennis]|uniref:Carboxylic ester hydrolase n=1 Tax=Agrilus planipennis TaxID=224129 RepID=A0A7F5RCN8_AGRPL|nr:acylcarnitine hydrolase isoform X2 [Agrilus planipennis]